MVLCATLTGLTLSLCLPQIRYWKKDLMVLCATLTGLTLSLCLPQIRYWKKDLMDSTLHEELIIIPESSRRRRRATPFGFDGKIRGKVSGLPSFSEIEADVVAVNTYFPSNGSNVVNFSTPEGGEN